MTQKVSIYKDKAGNTLKVHSDIENTRRQLQAIADELGLPLEDQKVFETWSNRRNAFRHQLFEELLKPLYG